MLLRASSTRCSRRLRRRLSWQLPEVACNSSYSPKTRRKQPVRTLPRPAPVQHPPRPASSVRLSVESPADMIRRLRLRRCCRRAERCLHWDINGISRTRSGAGTGARGRWQTRHAPHYAESLRVELEFQFQFRGYLASSPPLPFRRHKMRNEF